MGFEEEKTTKNVVFRQSGGGAKGCFYLTFRNFALSYNTWQG